MATYKSKMEDSLITKIQLFLFKKSLTEDLNIKEYYRDENVDNIINEFKSFHINNELANLFSSEYYQLKEEDDIKYNGNQKTIKEIVSNLMLSTKYMISKSNIKHLKLIFEKLKNVYENDFKNLFPEDEFNKLLGNNTCFYCGITLNQITELGEKSLLNNKRSDTRGYTLEIDRKLPNLEYSINNCCMSCYWCNNAKTDEFSPKEFKHIAKGINIIWNKRLSENNKLNDEDYFNKIVKFPDSSKIWEIDYNTEIKGS